MLIDFSNSLNFEEFHRSYSGVSQALEEIDRHKKLKLYPYNETADREDAEAFEECLTRGGIPHDRVVTWLDSIATDNELPCPAQ